jgi:hypothetical protein
MNWSGPVDLGGLMGARLSEHAVHTWDIAVARDPSATVLGEAVPITLDTMSRLVGFVAKPAGWHGVIRVSATDPSLDYALSLTDSVSLRPWSAEDSADATLSIPAEAFLRVLYGRLDPDHTPAGISAEGVTLDDLRGVFKGF